MELESRANNATAADSSFGAQKPWLVQKFGGTSIGKFIENITGTIVQSYLPTNRVVVVCSARSSESKSLGTTNRLLRAAASAMVPGSIEYIETVKEIRLDHLDAAQKHITNPDILKQVQGDVNQDCDRLQSFLEAAQ
ncbi:Aspartokinase, partial [Gamsiella multidivaricata]